MQDGDKFVLIVPTAMAEKASLHSFRIPPKLGKPEESNIVSRGMVQMERLPVNQFLEIYAMLASRKIWGRPELPYVGITFKGQTDLSGPEVLNAFDTLLNWNGIKLVLADDGTINAVPRNEQ